MNQSAWIKIVAKQWCVFCNFFCRHKRTVTSGGPLRVQILSISCIFWEILAKIVCWHPPGSATGNIANHATHLKSCVDDTITMHSSSMYTACSSLYRGVSVQVVFVQGSLPRGSLSTGESLSRAVSVQGSLSRESLSRGLCPGVSGPWDLCPEGLCPGRLPRRKIQPETETSADSDLLEGTWYQAARQEVTTYRDPFPLCICANKYNNKKLDFEHILYRN